MNKKKNKLLKKESLDKLDVYRAHFIEGEDLEPRFEEYLEKMERAKTLLTTGVSMANVAVMIQGEFQVKRVQSYNIIRDSIDLFGDITKVRKDGMKYIIYENLMIAVNLAKEKEDYSAMTKALDSAAKLYGLYDPELDEIDAEAYTFPAQIIFSDNVNILNQKGDDTD